MFFFVRKKKQLKEKMHLDRSASWKRRKAKGELYPNQSQNPQRIVQEGEGELGRANLEHEEHLEAKLPLSSSKGDVAQMVERSLSM
jgi:hypothetical protein